MKTEGESRRVDGDGMEMGWRGALAQVHQRKRGYQDVRVPE